MSSVCHDFMLYQNSLTYPQNSFTNC